MTASKQLTFNFDTIFLEERGVVDLKAKVRCTMQGVQLLRGRAIGLNGDLETKPNLANLPNVSLSVTLLLLRLNGSKTPNSTRDLINFLRQASEINVLFLRPVVC